MILFLFIAFFLTAGLCHRSDSVHHFRYKYTSYFKVGIPEVGDQVAGLAFKAVVDAYLEYEVGFAIFKLSDVYILNFNEDFGRSEEVDFSDERFHPFEDEDLKRIVEQHFRVNLRDSEPFAIEYEETEHRWLANVRKGIASMLKNEILNGNLLTQEKDSVSSLFHQGHLVNNFIVEEETLFGICKAKYKIYQIPETMLTGISEMTPTRQEGAKNDLWYLSRSIDFDNCKEIVASHVHTTNNIRHKNKKLKLTRTSVSSYVLRGSPGDFDVYSVVTEGATTYPLSLFKEQAQSTVKQKLVLIDVGTPEVVPDLGPNLTRSATWMHEVWSSSQVPKDGKPHPWIVYSEKNKPDLGAELYGAVNKDYDKIEAVKKIEILEYIKSASLRLTDLHQEGGDPPPESIADMLEMASFYLKFLKKESILKMFDHIFERKVGVERQLIISAAAASGYNEAMEAIMDYMEEGKVEPFLVFTTFMTLQSNSLGSLNVSRIMNFLLRQEMPSEYLLVFARYLSEFCIHKTQTYVPEAGDTECDSSLINNRFIPYLKDIIYNEDLTWERAYAVKVLDLLRSGFTFEIVSPLIDGRVESSVALKAAAVRALQNWNIYQEEILRSPIIDLLTDVYSDVSQDLYVRTAALEAITSWHPSTKFWYNLALRTWKDPSKEFSSFASSLIQIYAKENLQIFEKQSKGAAFALKFSKPPSRFYSLNFAFSKEFLNKRAKFSLLSIEPKKGNDHNTISILRNLLHFSPIKIEIQSLHREKIINFNETVQKETSKIADVEEFLNKLYKEIKYVEHPIINMEYTEYFWDIFSSFIVKLSAVKRYMPSPISPDGTDPSKSYFGVYLDLMDKVNFHPNEMGLPLITYSSLPLATSFTTKFLPPESGLLFGSQSLLRLSSGFSDELAIFLPWNHQFSSVYVRSNLELTIPIGMKKKRILGTESHLRSSKTYFDIAYKKKFPLVQLSNIPMTLTYDIDSKAGNHMINVEIIKKLNITEKRINKVDPVTGIKYDLVMRADDPKSFGLGNFQFSETSSRFWYLDFYLEPENSETSELLVTHLDGSLLNPEEYIGPGLDPEEKEKNQVSFYDSFEERSRKIRKLLNNSNEFDEVKYIAFKFDFFGEVSRHLEAFSASHYKEGEHFDYVFQTIGFTSAGVEQQHIPKSICFNHHTYEQNDPERRYFDSSSSSKEVPSKEQKIEVLRGCTQSIFKTKVVYNISEERLTEIKEYCKANYGGENCYVENDQLSEFDSMEVTIHKEDDTIAKNAVLFFENLLEIPHVNVIGYEIPRDKTQLAVRRNFQNNIWNLYLKQESEDVFLATFPHTTSLRWIMNDPLNRKTEFFSFLHEYPKCTLTTNSVKTFDGVKFNYELSNCWTLVSQTEGKSLYNVLLVRKSQGESSIPDFKYIVQDSGRVIDFSNNEIKVNGSIVYKINEDDESYSYEDLHNSLIYKKGNSFLIYGEGFKRKPNIIVSNNKIEYYRGFRSSRMNGICGNGDGESIPEFIGPKKCIYNDGQTFTASWTGQSENCDSVTLKEYREKVDDYQTKCEPFYGHLKESPMNHRCLLFGWKTLVTSENSYCISAQPVTFCSSDCDIKKTKTVKVAYKCWPKEKAPERLITSIESKVNIVTYPIQADPYFFENSDTEIAKICKQFIE